MLSVVIPAFGPDRIENLETVLHCIKCQTYRNFETIVVEQRGPGNEQYHRQIFCKYISVPYQRKGFNRNWLMNVGANISAGDKLLFLECDIIFKKDYFATIIDYNRRWQSKPWFLAWDGIHFFNQAESMMVIKTKQVHYPESSPAKPSILSACGGSIFSTRDFFFKRLGMHNENYFGWGADDPDTALRAVDILGEFNIMPYRIIHLHHMKRQKAESRNENYRNYLATKLHPGEITKRLLATKLGKFEKPTTIEYLDLKA